MIDDKNNNRSNVVVVVVAAGGGGTQICWQTTDVYFIFRDSLGHPYRSSLPESRRQRRIRISSGAGACACSDTKIPSEPLKCSLYVEDRGNPAGLKQLINRRDKMQRDLNVHTANPLAIGHTSGSPFTCVNYTTCRLHDGFDIDCEVSSDGAKIFLVKIRNTQTFPGAFAFWAKKSDVASCLLKNQ